MMMDYSIHKGSFPKFYCTKQFFKNLDYSSYSYFSCRRLGNIRNIAGVNHSRCCAIAEILWSRLHTKFHDNWISSFRGVAILGRTDGQTDGQTDGRMDGVTALLDLISPSATQVKMPKSAVRGI